MLGRLERKKIIFLDWEEESQTQKPSGAKKITEMREVVKKRGLLGSLSPTERKLPLLSTSQGFPAEDVVQFSRFFYFLREARQIFCFGEISFYF